MANIDHVLFVNDGAKVVCFDVATLIGVVLAARM